MTLAEPPFVPTESDPAEGPRCPECLSLHRPGQRYCLECGARLADPGLPGASAERGAGLTPGRRLGLAIVAAVIVIGGVLVAWAVTNDQGDGTRRLLIAGPPHSILLTVVPGPAATTTVEGVTTAGPGESVGTLPTTPTAPESVPGSTDIPTFSDTGSTDGTGSTPTDTGETTPDQVVPDDWPPGTNAWAVVLISKEVDEFTDADMEALKATAASKGLSKLGLLDSSQHSSLNPGFRVLYQGPYPDFAAANSAALAAKRAGYAYAYPRYVAN